MSIPVMGKTIWLQDRSEIFLFGCGGFIDERSIGTHASVDLLVYINEDPQGQTERYTIFLFFHKTTHEHRRLPTNT